MASLVAVYQALRADPRLQKNWEENQPRLDRCLEAPLIARTSREIATAALLAVNCDSSQAQWESPSQLLRRICSTLRLSKGRVASGWQI